MTQDFVVSQHRSLRSEGVCEEKVGCRSLVPFLIWTGSLVSNGYAAHEGRLQKSLPIFLNDPHQKIGNDFCNRPSSQSLTRQFKRI